MKASFHGSPKKVGELGGAGSLFEIVIGFILIRLLAYSTTFGKSPPCFYLLLTNTVDNFLKVNPRLCRGTIRV
jgi:hypothetical protein